MAEASHAGPPSGTWGSRPRVRIYCDASGGNGFGGTALDVVIAGTWRQDVAGQDVVGGPSIAWKELLAIYLLLQELGPRLEPGTVVIATTDNESNAFALNNGTACVETLPLLTIILELAFLYKVRLLGDWIPRDLNLVCDLLSRLRPLPGLSPAPPIPCESTRQGQGCNMTL